MPSAARLLVIVGLVLAGAVAQAQQNPQKSPGAQQAPPAQQPRPATPPTPTGPTGPTGPPAPQRRAAPKPTTAQVIVRDVSGTPMSGVKVTISGPANLEVTTEATGMASLGALADGAYRFRFERDGYITFEREVNVRAGQPAEIFAALRIAPVAPAPPPPPPPPPAPAPEPAPRASAPGGAPIFVSIPAFLDKNYIGREPLKESVLGCLPDSTTRLLQLHDGIVEHTHADLDEILYVVAGEGAVRVRGESSAMSAGSMSIIPRGLPHAIERKGRTPLMVLSTLSGAPCRAPEIAQGAAGGKK